MKKAFVFILFIALAFSCKRKIRLAAKIYTGRYITYVPIAAVANITVYLSSSGAALNQATTLSTVSDTHGNFSFTNAQIHSSSEYVYELYIPSVDYLGGISAGLDGGGAVVNKDKLSISYTLGVVPHYIKLHLYLPKSAPITDTFTLVLQQNTYHKNFPNGNWQSIDNCSPCNITNPSHLIGNLDNYWMGWWQVTLDKTTNGVHIIKQDSFYVGYGATVTDTIPW